MKKNKKKKQENTIKIIVAVVALVLGFILGIANGDIRNYVKEAVDVDTVMAVAQNTIDDIVKVTTDDEETSSFDLKSIPKFTDKAYVIINNNIPQFEDKDYTTKVFENYSELDSLGRCGVAYANICKELMPTSAREEISSVKPSGWQVARYDFVDGKYLYNRCHLIGFQLAGENANKKNLITGTRYLNVTGMLPFENQIADYVKKQNKHVLYRVTPIFEGNNLVASGVQMEASSVEDKGKSINFNIYAYNNQPGVEIDYKTGKSSIKK